MLTIPDNILTSFEAILNKRAVAPAQRADYEKWFRYFLEQIGTATIFCLLINSRCPYLPYLPLLPYSYPSYTVTFFLFVGRICLADALLFSHVRLSC